MTRLYRIMLRVLPRDLRLKHGDAMVTSFQREYEGARERSVFLAMYVVAASAWDVVGRAAYEIVRDTPPALSHAADRPLPTPQLVLRRHAVSFTVAFFALTSLLVLQFMARYVSGLHAPIATRSVLEIAMLTVPFTAAMTLPMAVFIAVLREFTRLGADGSLSAIRHSSAGIRRMVAAVLLAAGAVTAVALVVNLAVVPRANVQLELRMYGGDARRNERAMSIASLREAAREAKASPAPDAMSRAASYEVEVQKKLALPAACLVLTLAAIALALRFPRGGMWLTAGASLVVFGVYYVMLLVGEDLADRLVVPPAAAMWGANALLLSVVALSALRTRRGDDVSAETGTF
jgi:lipopolysaccharide export LptBFGC system permease protein LptF